MTTWLDALPGSEHIFYSQCGEEGVLETIFDGIGTASRYLVDIGAGDGETFSNTRLFLECGWKGARFDKQPSSDVIAAHITAENVCDALARAEVPAEFDLLSLDIDGIDWYVLRELLRKYTPRVFVCEINPGFPAEPPICVTYDPNMVFEVNDYFGASLGAYRRLAESRGYALVYCMPWNAFFVRRELLPAGAVPGVSWAPNPVMPSDPYKRPWVTLTDKDLA